MSIAAQAPDGNTDPRRCQNGVHRDGRCPTCRSAVWPHDEAAMETEWSAQTERPDGTWHNVGVGGTTYYTSALSDYNDWCRDVGAEHVRLVARAVPAWPTTDLLTPGSLSASLSSSTESGEGE